MAQRNSNPIHEPRLNERDTFNLKEIFKLEQDEDRKVDYDALMRIFAIAGFEPNARQIAVFKDVLEANNGFMTSHQFLQVFDLKKNQNFQEVDVRNAFRLLSREYDRPGMIKLERVKEFFADMGITDMEIVQLTAQLQPLCDSDGFFDYENFVTSSF